MKLVDVYVITVVRSSSMYLKLATRTRSSGSRRANTASTWRFCWSDYLVAGWYNHQQLSPLCPTTKHLPSKIILIITWLIIVWAHVGPNRCLVASEPVMSWLEAIGENQLIYTRMKKRHHARRFVTHATKNNQISTFSLARQKKGTHIMIGSPSNNNILESPNVPVTGFSSRLMYVCLHSFGRWDRYPISIVCAENCALP